jgi:hypothetical protein
VTIVWVEAGLAGLGARWEVIEEGSLGRTEGSLGGSEDMMFSRSDVGELEGMGTLGDRIGSVESGAATEWRLEAMGGSCNSTMGLRDGVEECDNGGSREQGAAIGSGDVAEIIVSKGKGMVKEWEDRL